MGETNKRERKPTWQDVEKARNELEKHGWGELVIKYVGNKIHLIRQIKDIK